MLARERCTLLDSDDLPAGVGALCGRDGDDEWIVVRPGLTRAEWREAVGHEVIHLERGPLIDSLVRHPSAATWSVVVAREERAVDAVLAGRLIPAGELAEWLRGRDGVTAADIAGEFEVTRGLVVRHLRVVA